jgi:hypothetical protein
MYVERNIEMHLRNHCCSGKAIRITYSECAFLTLRIQHAMCMRHIVICGLPSSTIFFHIFEKKVIEQKNGCFDFLYNFCLKYFSFYE